MTEEYLEKLREHMASKLEVKYAWNVYSSKHSVYWFVVGGHLMHDAKGDPVNIWVSFNTVNGEHILEVFVRTLDVNPLVNFMVDAGEKDPIEVFDNCFDTISKLLESVKFLME